VFRLPLRVAQEAPKPLCFPRCDLIDPRYLVPASNRLCQVRSLSADVLRALVEQCNLMFQKLDLIQQTPKQKAMIGTDLSFQSKSQLRNLYPEMT
jgi:hypothetical protein